MVRERLLYGCYDTGIMLILYLVIQHLFIYMIVPAHQIVKESIIQEVNA